MPFTPFGDDLNIIAKLQDEPNDADGLTAEELKAKFDEAGNLVQQYMNGILLPEAAQAIIDALDAAKLYTDEKVVQISSADMAMAVYDPERKQENIFAYADTQAAEQSDAVRQELARAKWYGRGLIANSGSGVESGSSGGEKTAIAAFNPIDDPDGILSADKTVITIPADAKRVLLTCKMRWGTNGFADASMEVLADGIVVATKGAPSSSTYIWEDERVALDVTAGQQISIRLRAMYGSGYVSAAHIRGLRLEVLE